MQAELPQSGAMLDGSPLPAWPAPSTHSQTHLLLQLWDSGRCTKSPADMPQALGRAGGPSLC